MNSIKCHVYWFTDFRYPRIFLETSKPLMRILFKKTMSPCRIIIRTIDALKINGSFSVTQCAIDRINKTKSIAIIIKYNNKPNENLLSTDLKISSKLSIEDKWNIITLNLAKFVASDTSFKVLSDAEVLPLARPIPDLLLSIRLDFSDRDLQIKISCLQIAFHKFSIFVKKAYPIWHWIELIYNIEIQKNHADI